MNKILAVFCSVVGLVLLGLTLRGGAGGAPTMILGAILLALGVIALLRGKR